MTSSRSSDSLRLQYYFSRKRVCRLQGLLAFLDEIKSVGCDLYLYQQAVDTTTPVGRALFQMMGVFAEFERSMIRERS